ncbi:hypothetical protein [Roseateles sp.]|uniref:hypothetical protein n=1 Tax=Roseateles sp. TaxID=1971397 RepID=UPI00345CDCB3
MVRRIKAKEFRQHDPEWFAVHASLDIVTICVTAIGFVLPFALHPLLMPCAPLAAQLATRRCDGQFPSAWLTHWPAVSIEGRRQLPWQTCMRRSTRHKERGSACPRSP